MATTRPFAYNTGSTITDTEQVGQLAIGGDPLPYSENYGGVSWKNGPDEDLGYVIGYPQSGGTQPLPVSGTGYVQFWRSKIPGDDTSFINLVEYISRKYSTPQTFANANDAKIWLNSNGFWTSYEQPVTPTPTATNNPTQTPTPTETSIIPTPTSTEGPTPTPTPTNTGTPNETPTNTPTPSVTPEPVTGYSFNLVALPYTFPSSGNTIMNGPGGATSGTTDPNVLDTGARGIYWNSIDSDGINRTDYFSGFTGQSITITMSQTGSTAIYSGDSQSLKSWTLSADTGFVFGAGIGVPPVGSPSGTAVLIQSASTEWTIGLPVYISVVLNGGVTPTPTPTQTTTPTETSIIPTPTSTEGPTPTPTPSETSLPLTPTPTETPIPSSGFTITITENGSDVIWEGSGSFDLTDLTFDSNQSVGAGYDATSAIWLVGPTTATFADFYDGVTTFPSSFGSGNTAPNNGYGDIFGILPSSNRYLAVPSGYTSNTFISGSTTYTGQTISSMGLTPGTYTWSWGTGLTSSSINMIIGGSPAVTPTPTETSIIPTPTPTETSIIPTPTPTETSIIPTPTPTETSIIPTPTITPTPTTPFTLKVESANSGVTITDLISGSTFTYNLTSGSFPITNSAVYGTHSATGTLNPTDVLLNFNATNSSTFTITKNGVELVNFPASAGSGQQYVLGSQFSNILSTDVMILKFQ
jgi:hypothetical protein